MTVKELKKKLENISDDKEVVIDLAPSGHLDGWSSVVKVINGYSGFDWEHGMFVLKTEKPVDIWYDKCKNCKIPDDGRVTSRFILKNLETWDHELEIKLDGKTKFKVPYSKEDILRSHIKNEK